MLSWFRKVKKVLLNRAKYDIKYLIFEKFYLWVGKLSIEVSKFIYRDQLKISLPFRVWGNIRFLIYGPGSIEIGKNFHAVSTRKRSFITLFSPCHLSIVGDAKIILGEHVGLNGTTIVSRKKILIGDNTMIGPNTIIVDHDGHVVWPPSERWTKSDEADEVIIESDVWIGMNAIILKGVRIGQGSIIAAGSVVVEDVDPGSLYAGNPAKKVKQLSV